MARRTVCGFACVCVFMCVCGRGVSAETKAAYDATVGCKKRTGVSTSCDSVRNWTEIC